MAEKVESSIQHNSRYVPLLRELMIRTTIGFTLLLSSVTVALFTFNKGRFPVTAPVIAFAWLISVLLTDKYVHKYPQRYFTYLVASHLKAAIIMTALLWIMGLIAGPLAAPRDVLWGGYLLFTFADVLVSGCF